MQADVQFRWIFERRSARSLIPYIALHWDRAIRVAKIKGDLGTLCRQHGDLCLE
jgi:hypothetical protein